MKKKLFGLAVLLLVGIALFWLFSSSPEPLEDTNGPDNYNLQVIKDSMIIDGDMGMSGGVKIKDDMIGSGLTFSSGGFTGVYEVLWANYVGKSDIMLDVTNLTVTEGNFKAVLLLDDEIVGVIPFNAEDPFYRFYLEDVNGTFSFRIAGESAAFKFSMVESEYDSFQHP